MEKQTLSPGEVVVAVLHYYREAAAQERLTSDREILQKAFYRIRNLHSHILNPVRFVDRGLFPESTRLDQAISNMEAAGLVKRQNAKPRFYEIDASLHSAFEKYVKPKLKEAKITEVEMKKVGADFQAEVSSVKD
jgi:hypothetical protein